MRRTPSDALSQLLARLFTNFHLAAACDCSVKTIGRDLQLLKQAHIPLDYDPKERAYVLPEESAGLLPVTMTATDALALALMRGLLVNADSPLPFAAEMQGARQSDRPAGSGPAIADGSSDSGAASVGQGGAGLRAGSGAKTDMEKFRQRLLKVILVQEDSLRIYKLASKREEEVVVHGRDLYRDLSGPLII